jgi:hypothetical protein
LTISSIRFFGVFRALPAPSLTITGEIYVHVGIVRVVPPLRTRTLAGGVAAAAALAALALATSGAAKAPGCSSFPSQAAAQEHFTRSGGGPSRNPGRLDEDRDGVACEELPGPYGGFATIGYNLKRRFFYGTASMPSKGSGSGEFACLYGNRHFADGPRILKIYRVASGADRAVSGEVGAETQPSSGHLVWKLDKDVVPRGRYYVAFEEQIRLSPYKDSECPGFRSREVLLP